MKELNEDLDFTKILLEKRTIGKKHRDRLKRKYDIRRKRLNIVREEMKQQIKAASAKIKQLTFELTNMNRMIFSIIKYEVENHNFEIPISVEPHTFWRGIWGERKEHHKDPK